MIREKKVWIFKQRYMHSSTFPFFILLITMKGMLREEISDVESVEEIDGTNFDIILEERKSVILGGDI